MSAQPTYARLTLHGAAPSEEAAWLTARQTSWQRSLFDLTGIVMPLIEYVQDAGVDADRLELRLNGELLDSCSLAEAQQEGSIPEPTWLLQKRAADLVSQPLLERYLVQLSVSFPDLVRVVRATFTPEVLADRVAERIRDGASIHDFRGALEELLLP